jgi:hypothetical protein
MQVDGEDDDVPGRTQSTKQQVDGHRGRWKLGEWIRRVTSRL